MKFILPFLSCLLFVATRTEVVAQDLVDHNIDLIGHLNFSVDASDIWGYADDSGNEYAIMGLRSGTVIIDVSTPADPVEVARIRGDNSKWRDYKSFGDYVYGVAEKGDDGLLVIDMNKLDSPDFYKYVLPETDIGGVSDTLRSAHNLFIDEKGWCYVAGSNLNRGGIVAVDVMTDPWNPVIQGFADARYCHDLFARGDTIWSADLYEGYLSVMDASDRTNIFTYNTRQTSSRFTHNCWLSDDGKTLFTTDEVSGAFIDIFDVRNIMEIEELARFRTYQADKRKVPPHNVYFFQDYILISYYSDGLVIVDVHNPEFPIQVASLDTRPGGSRGFNGLWGVYPWLPSGIIIGSDIQNGLLVFEPDFKRASYLTGKIRNQETGLPVSGAKVELIQDVPNEYFSGNSGDYKSGVIGSGNAIVTYQHPLYETDTIEISLSEGQITRRDVDLVPLYRSYTFIGTVADQKTMDPIGSANVQFREGVENYNFTTGVDGRFGGVLFEGSYQIGCGSWGHKDSIFYVPDVDQNTEQTFFLEEGYRDRFFTDQGWQVENTSATGQWVRAIPLGTAEDALIINPFTDAPWDVDSFCYVTGNIGQTISDDDIDGGYTWLISPSMDLSSYNKPRLDFGYWYFNGYGDSPPNDTLFVELLDNTNRSVHALIHIDSSVQAWQRVRDIPLDIPGVDLSDVQVRFRIGDLGDLWHVVEAGIDAFEVTDSVQLTGTEPDLRFSEDLLLFPNPAQDEIFIELEETLSTNARILIYDSSGKMVLEKAFNNSIPINGLPDGIYFLQVNSPRGKLIGSARFIVGNN